LSKKNYFFFSGLPDHDRIFVGGVLGNYSLAGFEMVLVRHVMHYIINYYLPSGLFVVVSWISFLVPADVLPGNYECDYCGMSAPSPLASALVWEQLEPRDRERKRKREREKERKRERERERERFRESEREREKERERERERERGKWLFMSAIITSRVFFAQHLPTDSAKSLNIIVSF
jgi:hypothetical protein